MGLGSLGRSVWQKRLFRLVAGAATDKLEYFKNSGRKRESYQIVAGTTVERKQVKKGRRLRFRVTFPDRKQKGRLHLDLSAEQEADCVHWITVLNRSIDKANLYRSIESLQSKKAALVEENKALMRQIWSAGFAQRSNCGRAYDACEDRYRIVEPLMSRAAEDRIESSTTMFTSSASSSDEKDTLGSENEETHAVVASTKFTKSAHPRARKAAGVISRGSPDGGTHRNTQSPHFEHCLFALVADGHGGSESAEFVARRLPSIFRNVVLSAYDSLLESPSNSGHGTFVVAAEPPTPCVRAPTTPACSSSTSEYSGVVWSTHQKTIAAAAMPTLSSSSSYNDVDVRASDGGDLLLLDKTIVESSFRESFVACDRELRLSRRAAKSGACVVSLVVSREWIHVAHVGDCRAVALWCTVDGIGTTSNFVTEELTTDHKPNVPEERRRIRRCGGLVVNNRLDGVLAVSRSIGDFAFKRRRTPSFGVAADSIKFNDLDIPSSDSTNDQRRSPALSRNLSVDIPNWMATPRGSDVPNWMGSDFVDEYDDGESPNAGLTMSPTLSSAEWKRGLHMRGLGMMRIMLADSEKKVERRKSSKVIGTSQSLKKTMKRKSEVDVATSSETRVSANPDVSSFRRKSLGRSCRCIVAASDGLWDVYESSDAMLHVESNLRAGRSPTKIAEELVAEAQRRGSLDDITAVVIDLAPSLRKKR